MNRFVEEGLEEAEEPWKVLEWEEEEGSVWLTKGHSRDDH